MNNLITRSRAANICANFSSLKILVIGDLMLDHWVWGEVSRICPEAPVPVVDIKRSNYSLGGAANVAANLRALGAKVDMVGAVGADEAGRRLRQQLSDLDIGTAGLCVQDDVPTILKSRIMARNQQVVRTDIELRRSPTEKNLQKIASFIAQHHSEYNAIVFSDYDKGLLWNGQGARFISLIKGVPVTAGPKPSNLTEFRGIDTITLNASEATQGTGYDTKEENGLLQAGASLQSKIACQNAIITLGARGMSLFRHGQQPAMVPALASQVYEVSGAGDTVLSVVSLCRALGIDGDEAIALASHAAAIVVRKVGTATISCEELLDSLGTNTKHTKLMPERKILNLADARARVERWRSGPTPKRVAFTNGCFDILHIGHLRTLLAARQEGDVLIVGLNSDASVRRLKGESRPINSQDERAALLAAMECVDMVIIFDDDTPLETIETLKPDVHVKGSDYNEDDLPEAGVVKSYGGKIVLAKLLPGHSTTSIILKSQK